MMEYKTVEVPERRSRGRYADLIEALKSACQSGKAISLPVDHPIREGNIHSSLWQRDYAVHRSISDQSITIWFTKREEK